MGSFFWSRGRSSQCWGGMGRSCRGTRGLWTWRLLRTDAAFCSAKNREVYSNMVISTVLPWKFSETLMTIASFSGIPLTL